MHGAWHGGWCWNEVVDGLARRGHRATAVDLPGHDRPGDTTRLWNRIPDYTAAVRDAIDACPSPPVLVGHSMGGYVVQRLLETASVPQAVLVASVPRRGVLAPNLRLAREHPIEVLRASCTLDYSGLVADADRVRELFFHAGTPDATVRATHASLQNESALAILTMIARPPRPKAVTSPVTVVAAEADAIFTVAEQQDLAAAYGTTARIVPGGHDIMLDTARDTLVDILDGVADRRSEGA